ncbi:MAG TPA: tripartite tricarboxylate transporter substrate-binding protein, partial [Bordetella sp.]|nr:tripartite tricarboxylate transporter substrate-binding protein [Bordetella sp.]
MHPLPCPAPLRALVALLKTCLCLAILLSGLGTRPAGAQENFPGGKPVTILVPFASGGSPDLLARHLATSLGKLWNSPVVVENRPGAGGNIAAGAVARAAPDGHTLLMGTDGPLAINPSLYAAMPYDPIRDFEPIGMVATVDFVLVTAPELGKPDLRRFIALAGQHNPPMAYGSSGVGSQHHLGMETFRMQEGIELRHVPYRGVAPALADVMGNHVPVMFAAIPSAAPLIQSGKVHAVAVTSSQRSAMLPGVPTMREAG